METRVSPSRALFFLKYKILHSAFYVGYMLHTELFQEAMPLGFPPASYSPICFLMLSILNLPKLFIFF